MITTELTKHLAELGKLTFTDNELEKMTSQMDDIIALMDKVKDFDENEKPYTSGSVSYQNLRPDKTEKSYDTEKILANSKLSENNCFTVPKVV